MATKQSLEKLKKIKDSFEEIDMQKLFRSSLGEESLESTLKPKVEELNKKIDFILEYASKVHDTSVNNIASTLSQIQSIMKGQAEHTNPDYISQATTFVQEFDNQVEQILNSWYPFVSAAIESRGFLEDEGIRKESQLAIENMKRESEEALKLVKEEANKTIEEAKKLAQDIEQRARRTAAHISVEAAQKEFKAAQKTHLIQVIIWAVISFAAIVCFILVAIYLLKVKLPEEWQWHIIYYTAIRITILTAIGAVAGFCLRIFRASMHMYQHNQHRQRVTNSMAAFVESAVTPEQRDLILGHLVDAVAMFGRSGLLQKEDDSIYSPKMTVDSISRTFSSSPEKTS